MFLSAGCDAQAVHGDLADVAILDRDTGTVLRPHYYRGDYWVAGTPGSRYAVEIRNRVGERLLAVTSVDGINVISGATASWDQTGYVFGPGERYRITGWRKSDVEVAGFTFTASPNSYAERTGRPANVGVIGIAVFRERPALSESTPSAAPPSAPPSAPPPTPPAEDSGAAPAPHLAEAQGREHARTAEAAPKLGTGHGAREYSWVSETEFSRRQPQPDEIIRIRYDSLDNLVAQGIIERPRPAWPSANPFPGSLPRQYAPDPPG
jgi:hypothetical protein